jgi:crotonobetainyl-CoA:carnitine CoA-transferase CaiB-like acyl-CoA transferase
MVLGYEVREMNKFLDGVRVLELGALTAGPNCARMLSNMGAEVIKIEQPGIGELGRRHGSKEEAKGYFEIQNYNKKSIGLNLGTPRGKEIIQQLISVTDILVQNLAPNAVDRWGIGPEETCAKHPRLIYCSVNGFGRNGPLSSKRALDTILQAMSGVVSMTGAPDGPPTKSGVSSADASGAAAAVGAILAALHYRNRIGRGQIIDTSMLDVMGWMTMEAWPATITGTGIAGRTGNVSPDAVPQNVYQCTDGYVAISVQNDKQWLELQNLLELAHQKAWRKVIALQDRVAYRLQIDVTLSGWIGNQKAVEVENLLQKNGIPAVKVLEAHEVLTDPHVIERGMVASLKDKEGNDVKVLGFPVRGSEAVPVVKTSAPLVGENNYEIYQGLLGFSDKELALLHEEGVI